MRSCKFYYGQEVKVKQGFYRGQVGTIDELIDEGGEYEYKIKIGKEKKQFPERDLKANLKFSFFGL